MDGASLPALIAPQGLAGAGSMAGAAPGADAAGAGFAALLGATELAGLTAEQQAALGQLLTDTAEALAPAAAMAGKVSPPAAIVGLLDALGVDLDRVLAGGRDRLVDSPGDGQNDSDAAAGLGALLADLLESVLPRAAGQAEPPQPELPPTAGAAAVAAILAAGQPVTPAPAMPDPALRCRSSERGTAEGRAPAVPLWQMPGSALPEDNGSGPPTRAVDGSPAVPTLAASVSPAAVFAAALEVPARDIDASGRAIGGDAVAGVGALLDAEGALPGRAALAAAPEFVPPRTSADGVAVPVGERGWERAFAERVVWLVGQQIQSAEVKLNPPHLGPVEVRLALNGQEASVSFTVAHGTVRDAVEQAIPRLREMFAEQNLQIVNVDVGQRDASSQASTGDRTGNGAAAAAPGRSPDATTAGVASEHAAPRRRQSALPGLVDEYA